VSSSVHFFIQNKIVEGVVHRFLGNTFVAVFRLHNSTTHWRDVCLSSPLFYCLTASLSFQFKDGAEV